jgi:hypothetical protein
MGTGDASESFLKAATAREREARRRRRGKRMVLEEEVGAERRGKARRREAAAVAVEAMAIGGWCGGGASALHRRRVVVESDVGVAVSVGSDVGFVSAHNKEVRFCCLLVAGRRGPTCWPARPTCKNSLGGPI